MKFTEARLEEAIIGLLGEQGYPHYTGDQITRSQEEVLITGDLKEYLAQRYNDDDITEEEIQQIVRDL